ncbi:MAG TPA: DUF2892 domain-containing protein [Chlorobaculum sp.]|nr:DUF2892 domain-containing protein [Chlorobaculum sp.]
MDKNEKSRNKPDFASVENEKGGPMVAFFFAGVFRFSAASTRHPYSPVMGFLFDLFVYFLNCISTKQFLSKRANRINNHSGATMKKNMGQKDRAIRAIFGVLLLLYGLIFQNLIGAIGLIPLVTALIGTCPLYSVLGVTSNRYED